jgi:uncharacterized protein (TIGR02722 family)
MKKTVYLMVLSIFALALSSCGPKAFVKGEYDDNVEDTNLLTDGWSETDMQKSVKELVDSALKHRAIATAPKPPIVMVTRLQNKTSEHIDTQNITDMITVELTKSGSVQFVDKAARDDMAEEYDYQNSGMVERESRKGKGKQIGADLILNGRIESIVQEAGKDKTIYYKITLNMTNLATGIIVWTDHKQMRKLFRKKRVGL